MGQSSSTSVVSNPPDYLIPETVGVIQDEVLRHARVLSEIATLTYEEFQICLGQLNALSKRVIDSDGKQLVFAVKKGTDSTVLWKGTIRIACVKLDPETKAIDNYRLLNLNQFLNVFKTLQCQLTAALQSSQNELMTSTCDRSSNEPQIVNQTSREYESDSDTSEENISSYQDSDTDSSMAGKSTHPLCPKSAASPAKDKKKNEPPKINHLILTASQILEEVDNLTLCFGNESEKLGECCICLERKPDVMLPCAHAYCMVCIEQWNTSHKTCPICRETLDSTDDTWVISDIPGSQEISEEICSALMKLTSSPK